MTTPNRCRTATMHPNGSRTTRDSQAALRSTCNLDNPFFLSTRNSFYPETGHQLSACGRKEETEMNAQNVLLVDDQPLIRKSLRSILESIDENLIIIAASSLEEAIRYIHSGQQPLLTLLDLQLPDATGTVTLDTFRRKCPGLPIVAMIERADQAVTHACQVAGTLGLVLKNADTQPITDCLRTAIRLARNSNDPKSGSGSAPASHAAVVRPEFQDHLSIPKANAPQGLRVQPAVYPGSNTAPAQPHREYRDGRHLGLSERQRSVLRLMMLGLPNKSICRELGLAEGTVKVHVSSILRILGISSRAQVAMAAMRSGIQFEDIATS